MEQLKNVLPDSKEENQLAAMIFNEKKNSPLLIKVHQNFGIFGGISLMFGVGFSLLFYKAKVGINALLFTGIMILLLVVIMNKLLIPIKRVTKAYYVGAILLGLSSLLTSSWILQFLNMVGILLLLDLSLLHQLYEDHKWSFPRHFGRMVWLVIECLATLGMPFKDGIQFLKNTKFFKNDKFRNVCIGITISIPLLWVIVGLLSSADLLFGKMTQQVYSFLYSSNIFYVIAMTLFGFLICYCIICGSVLRAGIDEKYKEIKKADSSIAITVVFLLCLVYVIFCGLQVLYLFANGLFVLPEEFTFAEYARRGFFELLTVTGINILLMLICTTLFHESKIIRFLLTCMTACTYIMIGSAIYRMLLYISAYNLTFLRLFVLLFLLIDSVVLAGVIISVYYKKFLLFQYCVLVVTIFYCAFSFARPDYFIASYHIRHMEQVDSLDINYLTEELSYDAAPVLVPILSRYDMGKNHVTIEEDTYDNSLYQDSIEGSIHSYFEHIILEEGEREIRDFNYSYYLASKSIKNIRE